MDSGTEMKIRKELLYLEPSRPQRSNQGQSCAFVSSCGIGRMTVQSPRLPQQDNFILHQNQCESPDWAPVNTWTPAPVTSAAACSAASFPIAKKAEAEPQPVKRPHRPLGSTGLPLMPSDLSLIPHSPDAPGAGFPKCLSMYPTLPLLPALDAPPTQDISWTACGMGGVTEPPK